MRVTGLVSYPTTHGRSSPLLDCILDLSGSSPGMIYSINRSMSLVFRYRLMARRRATRSALSHIPCYISLAIIVIISSTSTTPPYLVQLRIIVASHWSLQSSSAHKIDMRQDPRTPLSILQSSRHLFFGVLSGGVGSYLSLLAVYPSMRILGQSSSLFTFPRLDIVVSAGHTLPGETPE